MPADPYDVLFLRTGNSARSIIAEAIMTREGMGRFRAFMTAHWGVPDPVKVEGSEAARRFAFSDAYRMLRSRISIFVSLPIGSLDRLTLQRNLDEIGGTTAAAD